MEQRDRPRPVAAPPPPLLAAASNLAHHFYRPPEASQAMGGGGGGSHFDYRHHNIENDWQRAPLNNLPQTRVYQLPERQRHHQQQHYEPDMMIQSPLAVLPRAPPRTRTTSATSTTTTAPSMMPVVGGETPVDLLPDPNQVLTHPNHHHHHHRMMINNSSGSLLGAIEAAKQPATMTHFRQLPSMTTVINSNNYKKSTANSQMKLSDLNNHQAMPPLQVINSPLIQPPTQTIRRSLPPMNCLVNQTDELEVGRHSLNANQQLNDSSSYQPMDRLNYEGVKRRQANEPSPHPAAMRQLPIITPYGPKPINSTRVPLRELHPQNRNSKESGAWRQTTGPQLMIKNMINTTSNSTININKQQQIKSSSNIAHDKPLAQTISSNKPNNYIRSSINTTTTSIDRPRRQLPIITKQGVLKLRPEAANFVSDASVARGGRRTKSYKTDSDSQYTQAARSNGKRPSFREYDSQTDDEYSQNMSDDAVADSVRDRSSEQGDNIFDSDGNITSPKSLEDQQMEVEEEEVLRDSQGEEEIEICMPEEEEETLPEDELEEEEEEEDEEDNYYDNTRQPTEDEAEAEYYSALATVPEEEVKPNDKDSSQDYNYGDDDVDRTYSESGQQINEYEGDITTATSNNMNANQSNKLPTIIENGFEAQVLEYLAEKTGVRKTELFSVDEEPSSYNDEVDNQLSQTAPNQQTNIDDQIVNDSEYLNDEMINNAVQKDYSEQAIERQEELLKVNLLDDQTIDPTSYNIVETDGFSQDFNGLEFQQQQPNLAYPQPTNMSTQKQSIEQDQMNQYQEHQLNDQLTKRSDLAEDEQHQLQEHQLQRQHLDLIQEEQEIKLLVPEMKFSTNSEQLNRNISNELELYNDEEKMMNYDIEEEEEDDRILMSPANDKTSLEQEEYDDQYRDINNLEDLDRRATNHVHAIDGHSKSMLNGIHQQRTINDYYDDNDLQVTAVDAKGDMINDFNAYNNSYGEEFANEQNDNFQLNQFQEEIDDKNKVQIQVTDEDANDQQYHQQQREEQLGKEGEESQMDEFADSNLPRARIRWIRAVNKIVNRGLEVS